MSDRSYDDDYDDGYDRASGDEAERPYSSASDDSTDAFYRGDDNKPLPQWAQEQAEDYVKAEASKHVEQMARDQSKEMGKRATASWNAQVDDFQADLESGRGSEEEQDTEYRSWVTSKLLASLCYFFGIIGAIVGVLAEKQDFYVLANAWQCLFMSVPLIIIAVAFSWLKILREILWCAYWLCCLIMIGFVWYKKGTSHILKIPCIGSWSEARAHSTINYHATVRITSSN